MPLKANCFAFYFRPEKFIFEYKLGCHVYHGGVFLWLINFFLAFKPLKPIELQAQSAAPSFGEHSENSNMGSQMIRNALLALRPLKNQSDAAEDCLLCDLQSSLLSAEQTHEIGACLWNIVQEGSFQTIQLNLSICHSNCSSAITVGGWKRIVWVLKIEFWVGGFFPL